MASYKCERHLVYSDMGGSHVGRSTQLLGPLLLVPNNSIGEHSLLQRSVLGTDCTIHDECSIIDSHLWGNVVVEKGTKIIGAVLCEGVIIKSNAVMERGCIVGRGCVVGEGVVLQEFTRIMSVDKEEGSGDDYSGFDESEEESSEEEDSDNGDDDKKENIVVSGVAANFNDAITVHDVLGTDGLGPSIPDDYNSDDDSEDGRATALETMKNQSIGYDMTLLYRRGNVCKWRERICSVMKKMDLAVMTTTMIYCFRWRLPMVAEMVICSWCLLAFYIE